MKILFLNYLIYYVVLWVTLFIFVINERDSCAI